MTKIIDEVLIDRKITLIETYNEKIKAIKDGIAESLKDINMSNFKDKLEALGYKQITYSISSKKDTDENLDILNKRMGIYVFSEKSQILTKDKWNDFKKNCEKKNGKNGKKNTRKFPAWNGNREYNNNNKIFYLGKSNNLKGRLLEHIEDPSASTYALRLSLFPTEISYSINVFYSVDDSLDFELVNSIIESNLHTNLKPLIGSSRS